MQVLPQFEADVRGQVRIGAILAAPVKIEPAGRALELEFAELASALAASYAGTAPGEIGGLQPARELYSAFGVDPTRTRPSSEALLRRALQGKPMPSVCNAVDVGNLCSLRFLLPIGLYDADRVSGEVRLRRGRLGEAYPGIRKEDVHLDRRLVLADEQGPFGNPSADSLRTAITEKTERVWMVIFAPAEIPAETVRSNVAFAASMIAVHLGAPGRAVETDCAVEPER